MIEAKFKPSADLPRLFDICSGRRQNSLKQFVRYHFVSRAAMFPLKLIR